MITAAASILILFGLLFGLARLALMFEGRGRLLLLAALTLFISAVLERVL